MILMMLVVMLTFSAFCVSICQIQLIETQTQIAADCSSVSAAIAIDNDDEQRSPEEMAETIASNNTIGFSNVNLSTDDVVRGTARVNTATGKIDFTPGGSPSNAVRVDVRVGNSQPNREPSDLWLPFFLTRKSFDIRRSSVSAKMEHDICLVIDRSQSMCDHKNQGGERPFHPNYLPPLEFWQERFFPHPVDSRWVATIDAVGFFTAALDKTLMEEELGLVTFACDRTYTYKNQTIDVLAATIDVELSKEYDQFRDTLENMFIDLPMVNGQTWIHSGIDSGTEALVAGRDEAFKTMVVLTDGGQFVQGDPGNTDYVTAAVNAADQGITIHTVTYGSNNGYTQMQEVARIGGGEAYFAPDEATLQEIFASIGAAPPISIIQ